MLRGHHGRRLLAQGGEVIINDSFSTGASTALEGRTPDTVNNGNDWYESGLFPANNYEVFGGTCRNTGGNLEYGLIDSALDDYRISYNCFSSGVTAANRIFLESRVSGMVNPTDRLTVQVDPVADLISVIERIGGVNSLLGTFTAVLPIGSEYLITTTLIGATILVESAHNGESGVFATTASTGGVLGFRIQDDTSGNFGELKGPFIVEGA